MRIVANDDFVHNGNLHKQGEVKDYPVQEAKAIIATGLAAAVNPLEEFEPESVPVETTKTVKPKKK